MAEKRKELDNILDAALAELDDDDDDDDDASTSSSSSVTGADATDNGEKWKGVRVHPKETKSNNEQKRPVFGPQVPPQYKKTDDSNTGSTSTEEEAIQAMMRQMETLFASEESAGTTATAASKSVEMAKEEESNCKIKSKKGSSTRNSTSNENENMDETMTKLLEKLSQNLSEDDDFEGTTDNFEAMGDDVMKEMAKEWEASINNGQGGEAGEEMMGQVVDGMMKQLLSREFMYEPMKDICDQFPQWLAENKSKITKEEYERYGKQYQYFQRIVHVYEHDPENTARLSELMHDIQEYGQPPSELIKKLAPDLEFGQDGIPVMDGAGFPPIPPGMDEECCIM